MMADCKTFVEQEEVPALDLLSDLDENMLLQYKLCKRLAKKLGSRNVQQALRWSRSLSGIRKCETECNLIGNNRLFAKNNCIYPPPLYKQEKLLNDSIFKAHQYLAPNQTPRWDEPTQKENLSKLQALANSPGLEKLKKRVLQSMEDIAVQPLRSNPTEQNVIKGHHCIFCTVTKKRSVRRKGSPKRSGRKSGRRRNKPGVDGGLSKDQQKELEARLLPESDYMTLYQALRNYKRYTRLPAQPDPLQLMRPGVEEIQMMSDSQRLTRLFEQSFMHLRRNPFVAPPRGHSPKPPHHVTTRELRKLTPPPIRPITPTQALPMVMSGSKFASNSLVPIEV